MFASDASFDKGEFSGVVSCYEQNVANILETQAQRSRGGHVVCVGAFEVQLTNMNS